MPSKSLVSTTSRGSWMEGRAVPLKLSSARRRKSVTRKSTPMCRNCTLRRATGHSCGNMAYILIGGTTGCGTLGCASGGTPGDSIASTESFWIDVPPNPHQHLHTSAHCPKGSSLPPDPHVLSAEGKKNSLPRFTSLSRQSLRLFQPPW